MNFITKRGGTEYHGTAYTYQRDTSLFNSHQLLQQDRPTFRSRSTATRRLGGTLGGPVPRIPKLNADGEKLFFFYSLDDTRLKNPQQPARFMMPTALERARRLLADAHAGRRADRRFAIR